MLVHQAKRLNSPCVMVTNHDATVLPNMYYHMVRLCALGEEGHCVICCEDRDIGLFVGRRGILDCLLGEEGYWTVCWEERDIGLFVGRRGILDCLLGGEGYCVICWEERDVALFVGRIGTLDSLSLLLLK